MSRWKELERIAARKLGGRRFPRWLDFSQSAPDVVVDDHPELVIDCKSRKRFSHHTLLEEIERKYCEPGQVPVLVTKAEGQRGEYVTVPLDFLAKLLRGDHEALRMPQKKLEPIQDRSVFWKGQGKGVARDAAPRNAAGGA